MWTPTINADGSIRDGAWGAEATGPGDTSPEHCPHHLALPHALDRGCTLTESCPTAAVRTSTPIERLAQGTRAGSARALCQQH